MELTEAQLNKLAYNDQSIANMKSDKQKLAIELSERDGILRKREELKRQIPRTERTIFINSKPGTFSEKFVKQSEITQDMIDKEIELGFINN